MERQDQPPIVPTDPLIAGAAAADAPAGDRLGTAERELAGLQHRALTGASATLIAQALKFALKFGSAMVLGRLLDPAQFGMVAMVAPVLAFVATLNDVGFGQAVVQSRDITPAQLSDLFWINMLISLGLAALLFLAAPAIGWVYGEPRTVEIARVLAITVVVGTLGMIPNALMARALRFVPLAIVDLLSLAVGVIVAIVLASLAFGYWALVLSQVTSTVVSLVAIVAIAGWWPGRPRRPRGIGRFMRFGAHMSGVNLATYVSMTADNMIVGAISGKTQLGLYDRSYSLVLQPLVQLTAPLGRVAVPLLSRLQDEPERFRSTYLMMLQLGMIATAPAMICCTLLSTDAVLLLLGEHWRAAGPVFGWVSFGGIVASIFSSTGWVFTAEGRTGLQLRLSGITAVISIASFALGARWGATGVAAVSALSFTFLQVPLMVWYMARDGRIRRRDIGAALLPMGVAIGATAAMVAWLATTSLPFKILIAAPLSYLLFALVAAIVPGGPDLRALYDKIRAVVPGLPRRRGSFAPAAGRTGW